MHQSDCDRPFLDERFGRRRRRLRRGLRIDDVVNPLVSDEAFSQLRFVHRSSRVTALFLRTIFLPNGPLPARRGYWLPALIYMLPMPACIACRWRVAERR